MSLTNPTAKNFQKFYNGILPYLNGAAHSGFTPVGMVFAYTGETPPPNYLACDGSVYNKADYPELSAHLLSTSQAALYTVSGDSTKFKVPDLRGEFIRGWGTNSHANQGSGAAVGVHQDGTTVPKIETYASALYTTGGTNGTFTNSDYVNKCNTSGSVGTSSVTAADQVSSVTTRPTNTSLMFVIASKNIFMDAGSNYSTEEQVVGTWIDGKPLYQKTINFGALPNATAKDINHNITNLGDIIYYSGYAIQPLDNTMIILPFVHHQTMSENVSIVVNKTIVRIRSGANKSTYTKSYITLRYTKTT